MGTVPDGPHICLVCVSLLCPSWLGGLRPKLLSVAGASWLVCTCFINIRFSSDRKGVSRRDGFLLACHTL